MAKTKIFNTYEEYEKWTNGFENASDYETIPSVVDTEWEISADMFVHCKRWKTAVRRFGKAFEMIPEIRDWIETLYESCENGIFEDHIRYTNCTKEEYKEFLSNGKYSYGVEEVYEGYWYVYLCISGIYADRQKSA